MRYTIITPVRNEAQHLGQTVESVLSQTLRPVEWVIVDDGSTDGTGLIIDSIIKRHTWIHAVSRVDRGFRQPGRGVVEAFNAGLAALRSDDFDFLVKLDGDLSFAPGYFEKCLERFQQDRSLGIAGGVVCSWIGGQLSEENVPAFHVRGATKIYKRECWNMLGGLWMDAGWDTIDEIKALRLGWTTRSFPDLKLIQHRATGRADGFWSALFKYGRANYICGYHPLFMLAKCARRLFRRPYVVGAAGLLCGFVYCSIRRVRQYDDPLTISFLRKQQWNKLFGGASIYR